MLHSSKQWPFALMRGLHTLGILSTSFTWNAFPTVLKQVLHTLSTCWLLFFHSAVQLIPNHLNPSPSVNSPSNYPHPHTVFIYLSCSFPPQYLYLHIHLCTSIIPVFNCYIVITSPPWPIHFLNLPHLHSLLTVFFVYSMCNCVVVCVELLRFILARLQL